MCVAACIVAALLTSTQHCMLHNANGGHSLALAFASAVLQQNKNKRSKEKKKNRKKARNVCQVQGQQLQRRCRVAFDAAVGCTPACLPACNVEALLLLCLWRSLTLTLHSHCCSSLSPCARVCVYVRLLCAFNFQFAVPKLYLKANFAVAVVVTVAAAALASLCCTNSSSRRSWSWRQLLSHSLNAISIRVHSG